MALQIEAFRCLMECDPIKKIERTQQFAQQVKAGAFDFKGQRTAPEAINTPGRPEKPEMIDPRKVPRRRLGSTKGRAALFHALAHIEFNAINLGLDAIYRFADMPGTFYSDWAKVAEEEAFHFSLLIEHMATQGFAYGDFPAHNGLWDMAVKTAGDVMARMALVPRVLEARGLDVTPSIIVRLEKIGDERGVEILSTILRDEITHVEIGNHWFNYCCEQRNLAPFETFKALLIKYAEGRVRGPFNESARKQAGFTEQELEALKVIERDFINSLK